LLLCFSRYTATKSVDGHFERVLSCVRYERLLKTPTAAFSGTLVISIDRLHQLLYVYSRFRSGSYSSRVKKLLEPGNMVLPQLFAMVQVVAHCTTHKRPPFQSQAKGANMIGLRVIMVWWKNTKHETWYCGEVIGQTSEGVNVHYHDDGSTVTMTHSELLAKCKSNEGYVVPRAYWDAQVQNVEEDKKRWAEAIDADTLPLKPSLPGAIGRQAKRQKLSAASVSAAAAAQDNSVVSSTFGKVLTATSSRLEVGSIVSVEFNEGAEVPVAYEGRVLSSAAAETNGGGHTDVYEVQFFADDLVIPVNPDTHVMRLIKSSASVETQGTTVTGKHQPAEGDELSPSTGCTICLEEFINMPGDKRVTSLGCGHQFCSECIEGWFMLAANRSCPTCRKCFAGLRQATTTTIRDIAVGTGEHKPPSNKVVSKQRVPARTSDASHDRLSKPPRAWSEAETQQLMAMAPSDCKWPFADSRWEDAARSLGTNRSGAAAYMKHRAWFSHLRRQTADERTDRGAADVEQVSSAALGPARADPLPTRPSTKKCAPISRHVGVAWQAGKWRVQISHEGRNHELGFFDQHDEEAAAHAYDAAARRLRGPQAHGGRAGWNGCHKMWLNFPTDVEQLQSAAPRAASADPMPTRPNPKKRGLDDRPISKYLGVAWNTQAGKWRAQIRDKGRYHILGFFNQRNEEAAAHAYDAAARGLRGPHAHGGRAGSSGPRWQLNFPTDAEQLQAAAVEPVRADSVPTRNDDDEEAARATSKKRGLNDRPISRHMGVCWATKAGKWLAQIGHGGQQQCLGFFDEHNEEAAARAYDAAARRLRGTQAHGGQASSGRTWRLNFPTDVEQLQAAALGAASADPVPTRNEVAARETAKSQQESDDESGEYEVETILERRRRRQPAAPSVMEYRVRWLGYGEEADTWEPLENLSSAQALVTEFDRCENLIGRRVRKKFIGCGIFEGTVSGHAGEGRLDVLYDDGEVKRVKLEALLKILLPPE
jgi:hypothetical protein